MENECCSIQLINKEGDFNVARLEEFMQKTELPQCGLSYAVVSIMGPQSSGKSTLLNHMFHTYFREMDASQGRNQTTQGIWIEKCAGVEPFIVATDLEGTDGSERGEDDTTFEKQSALFALAIADIMIINMWCHDVGRVHAANKPLLRTIFQVMMNIFGARKTTLLFVLRDKTKTPLHHLEHTLRKDAEKIWDSVHKPATYIDTPLSELFNVEVVALSSYEQNEELFKEEVAELRQRLLHSISRGLAGDRQDVVPASGFSLSVQNIWKSIKENKDLDLPSHKVMVATIRCKQIVNEKLHQLSFNKDWLELEGAIQSGPVSKFGSKLSSILEAYFSEYDREAFYFDEGVRNKKRKQLESKALDFVHPTYLKLLEHLRFEALKNFKDEVVDDMLNKGSKDFAASAESCSKSELLKFDQACADAAIRHVNWDTSEVKEKLFQDIDSSKSSVREEVLSKWEVRYKEGLNEAIAKAVESLFENPNQDTWAEIRKRLSTETENATLELSARISELELEGEKSNRMMQDLRDYATNVVKRKAKEKVKIVLQLMTNRFVATLNKAIAKKRGKKRTIRNARAESLRLLSAMAAMRLDEKRDKIEKMLFSSLLNGSASSKTLASSTWPEVFPEDTLITPTQCNSLWKQFEENILAPTRNFIEKRGMKKGRYIAIVKKTISKVPYTAIAETALCVAGAAVVIATAVIAPHTVIVVGLS